MHVQKLSNRRFSSINKSKLGVAVCQLHIQLCYFGMLRTKSELFVLLIFNMQNNLKNVTLFLNIFCF